MHEHPVLGRLTLGYAPLIDRRRALVATRLSVFPERPDAVPDPQALLAARIRSHPLGRIGTPEEIGQAVAWLCGDEAGWVTGQDFVMDGGLSLTAGVPR